MRPTLYLHGFLSHPNSAKPQLLRAAHEKVGKPFIAPELYMSPREVRDHLIELVVSLEEAPDLIGSSLGGYYAVWLKEHAEAHRAVLLNPALGNWGKVEFKSGWHPVSGIDKQMFVCESFMDELEEGLVRGLARPQDYLSLISLQDEVLDAGVTLEFLKGTNLIKIPTGDHRISNFKPHVSEIMDFLLNS